MQKKRYVVLDALRGFAILGIILANFPEFSLWTFSDPATWTRTDTVTRAVQTFFVDGKFYTLFSLLFGMGFSIQLANAEGKLRTFYRRMTVLLCIGLGLGNRVGLLGTELIALGVYAFQILLSSLWMRTFAFGPVEWVWRMLTYGKRLPLRRR